MMRFWQVDGKPVTENNIIDAIRGMDSAGSVLKLQLRAPDHTLKGVNVSEKM
jgi:hypothetical protein